MSGQGLLQGDYLIIDKAMEARNGDVVIASIDAAFTCKQCVAIHNQRPILRSANPSYADIAISDEQEAIFAVVTGIARCLR